LLLRNATLAWRRSVRLIVLASANPSPGPARLRNDLPACPAASAEETDLPLLLHLSEHFLDELRAGRRHLGRQVAQGEQLHLGENGLAHKVALGGAGLDRSYLQLELIVGTAQHVEEVVPPGDHGVPAFMPTLGAFGQYTVVLLLALLDETLKADVASDLEAV